MMNEMMNAMMMNVNEWMTQYQDDDNDNYMLMMRTLEERMMIVNVIKTMDEESLLLLSQMVYPLTIAIRILFA